MWAEVHGEGRSPKDGEEASGGPARLEGGGRAHRVQGAWEVTAKPLPRAREVQGP